MCRKIYLTYGNQKDILGQSVQARFNLHTHLSHFINNKKPLRIVKPHAYKI